MRQQTFFLLFHCHRCSLFPVDPGSRATTDHLLLGDAKEM